MIRICKKCKVELGFGEKVYCANCEDMVDIEKGGTKRK